MLATRLVSALRQQVHSRGSAFILQSSRPNYQTFVMRVTRSTSALAKQQENEDDVLPSIVKEKAPAERKKRKAPSAGAETTNGGTSGKKARSGAKPAASPWHGEPGATTPAAFIAATAPIPTPGQALTLVPAELTFSFEEAKQHLIDVDPRFEHVFSRLQCRPFEQLERVDPFRYECAFEGGVIVL